jgi:hypothetical protein
MSETVVIRFAEVVIIVMGAVVAGGMLGAFIGWITRNGKGRKA